VGRANISIVDFTENADTVNLLLSNRDTITVVANSVNGAFTVVAYYFSDMIYSRTAAEPTPAEAIKSCSAQVVNAYVNVKRRGKNNESVEVLDAFDQDGEKIDADVWGIDKIVAIRVEGEPDEADISNTLPALDEAAPALPLMTDLTVKNVKRGDVLWITATLRPKNASTAYAPGQLGVLKVRVVDLFYSLSALKYAK
jgi:hypothetical protein